MLCEAFTAATVLQSGKPVITFGGINSLPTSIALHIRDSPIHILYRPRNRLWEISLFGGLPFHSDRLPGHMISATHEFRASIQLFIHIVILVTFLWSLVNVFPAINRLFLI